MTDHYKVERLFEQEVYEAADDIVRRHVVPLHGELLVLDRAGGSEPDMS